MAILRVNVIFENIPLGMFTVGSFWKTWDQLGNINSPLLKTLVNESDSVGIGYWSNCSQGFAVTLYFLHILPLSWVLGARTPGTALALASSGEIISCPCNPTHSSSDPSDCSWIHLTTSLQPPPTTRMAPDSPAQIKKFHHPFPPAFLLCCLWNKCLP